MAPFPEAEIMTIKRLEVALRKMDYKLLKDGAYKLHEKYHSGHKFEYLDLLKEILTEITNNPSVPSDIKDILCPTIQDILSLEGNPYTPEYKEEERVSELTSLSYSIDDAKEEAPSFDEKEIQEETLNQENFQVHEEPKISAFDAFSPHKEEQGTLFQQSTFNSQPFKEFSSPSAIPMDTYPKNEEEPQNSPLFEQNNIAQTYSAETKEEQIQIEPQYVEHPSFEAQTIQETPKEKKKISIFYGQDSSSEKTRNILRLRELISKSREKTSSIDDFMALIGEITTQANTNVVELQGILEFLKSKENLLSLITNSQSADFTKLLDSLDITYSFYENKESNKLNVIPLWGLSNMFVCSDCDEVYLDKSNTIKPLVLECPKCKNPMYPDFWAPLDNSQINLEYYSSALVELANSKIWLLIHPSFGDKTTANLIETALKVNNVLEEVYVLDKDINVRENYKNYISSLKPNVSINAHNNTLEDFFKSI